MKHEYPPVYRESRAQARRLGETKTFKESFQLNVSCARAIEQAIHNHADEDDSKGFLFDGCARSVLDEYGFQRTQFVLANTLVAAGSLGFEPDNIPIAGHNRGVRNDFGKIHTLNPGDTITFTTKLGTRTYAVSAVTKVSVNDTSGLEPTAANQITLYTCVEDQPAYRWCVTAREV